MLSARTVCREMMTLYTGQRNDPKQVKSNAARSKYYSYHEGGKRNIVFPQTSLSLTTLSPALSALPQCTDMCTLHSVHCIPIPLRRKQARNQLSVLGGRRQNLGNYQLYQGQKEACCLPSERMGRGFGGETTPLPPPRFAPGREQCACFPRCNPRDD